MIDFLMLDCCRYALYLLCTCKPEGRTYNLGILHAHNVRAPNSSLTGRQPRGDCADALHLYQYHSYHLDRSSRLYAACTRPGGPQRWFLEDCVECSCVKEITQAIWTMHEMVERRSSFMPQCTREIMKSKKVAKPCISAQFDPDQECISPMTVRQLCLTIGTFQKRSGDSTASFGLKGEYQNGISLPP